MQLDEFIESLNLDEITISKNSRGMGYDLKVHSKNILNNWEALLPQIQKIKSDLEQISA